MTDSSTGGYVVPTNAIPAPLNDAALEDFLHDVLAGVTGLANDLVRPRWQEEPPNLPPRNVTWAAFGVRSVSADTFPAVTHDPTAAAGQGADILSRHQELTLLASFYGPASQTNAERLRDGLLIAQNREALFLAGMALVEVGEIVSAPELVKQKWLRRWDLPVIIRREVRREYPILNLLSASGDIISTAGTITFNVNP